MRVWAYRLSEGNRWRISLAWDVDEHYWSKRGHAIETWVSFSSIGKVSPWADHPWEKGNAQPFRPRPFHWDRGKWRELKRDSASLLALLEGRTLLWDELEAMLAKWGKSYTEAWLRRLLQWIHLEGKCEIVPGVYAAGPASRWRCLRCHASAAHLNVSMCARCGEACAYCEHCILLGRSRSCTPLIRVPAQKRQIASKNPVDSKRNSQPINPEVILTETQRKASEEIQAWMGSEEKCLLVWAVTGAGKTEIMVPVVRSLLEQEKRVLWVTPRTEVVHELAPRLQKALCPFPVLSLYGGSPHLWEKGSMVLATAHQMWRYHQWFDVAIVDEVDAFPLYKNRSLEEGIRFSLLPHAKEIFLTATPPDPWVRAVRKGKFPAVLVPIRYHGHPLPEPKFFRSWGLWRKLKNGKPLPPLSRFLKRVGECRGQAILFVPRVQDVEPVLNWLKEREPEWFRWAAGVYGEDLGRKRTVKQFRDGFLKLLVSTTILERGVTVPLCHVLVIGADHPVFDRVSLIQIAGRVGRHADEQRGQVWFLAEVKTQAQQHAIREIQWLNHCAKKEGITRKGGV